MSHGHDEDSGAGIDLATARGRDWPSVRQFNVFVANRLGGLAHVIRQFEMTDIRIVSLMVVDSADCAIIRLVLSDPERAKEVFDRAKLMVTESDLLVVRLPEHSHPLMQICKSLLSAELNIHYAYPLLVGPGGRAAVAIRVEDIEAGSRTLTTAGFNLLTEGDLTE